jgi:hypothetical protein
LVTGFAPFKGEKRYKVVLDYAEKSEDGVTHLLTGR